MSDAVSTDVSIRAAPAAVWEVVMDPARMGEWVTIHRKMLSADSGPPREGMRMRQCLALRGATFRVDWTLAQLDAGRRAVWEGKGPVGSRARTVYELTETADGGTDFHYENEFRAPGGVMGKAASRVLVGGLPKREADASLAQLKALLET